MKDMRFNTRGAGASLRYEVGAITRWIPAVFVLIVLAGPSPREAVALPGTHGMAISTWDTTLSTIALAFHSGLFEGGRFHIAGYNANFTSTSGRLSSQFGMHYLNYSADDDTPVAHGISGTATALFGIPVAGRYNNGLPKAALNFYLGAAPSALLSGQLNYLSIPVTVGIGMQFSPARWITIVPWIEVAPSFNIGTEISDFTGDLTEDDIPDDIEDIDASDIPDLTEDQVKDVLADAVSLSMSVDARLRGGLSFLFHLGNKVDIQINAIFSHVGTEFNGPLTVFVGGALVFGWDDPPPEVLPAEKRLENEDCRQIYFRFKQCPAYNRLVERQEEKKPSGDEETEKTSAPANNPVIEEGAATGARKPEAAKQPAPVAPDTAAPTPPVSSALPPAEKLPPVAEPMKQDGAKEQAPKPE